MLVCRDSPRHARFKSNYLIRLIFDTALEAVGNVENYVCTLTNGCIVVHQCLAKGAFAILAKTNFGVSRPHPSMTNRSEVNLQLETSLRGWCDQMALPIGYQV